jgi:hypothetical protein
VLGERSVVVSRMSLYSRSVPANTPLTSSAREVLCSPASRSNRSVTSADRRFAQVRKLSAKPERDCRQRRRRNSMRWRSADLRCRQRYLSGHWGAIPNGPSHSEVQQSTISVLSVNRTLAQVLGVHDRDELSLHVWEWMA